MHANCTCQSACLPELSAASPSIPAHTQKQHTPDSPLLGWGVEVLGHGAQRGGSDVHQAGQHLQNHAAHRETGKRAHVGWQGCEFQRQSVSASCAHMLNVVGVCGLSSCTPSRPLPCTPSRHPPTRFLRPPAAAGGGVHSWRHAQHPALEQRRAGSCPPLGVEGGAGPLQLRPAGSTAVGGGAGNTRLAAQPGSRRTAAFNALSGTFRACASSVGGQANEGGPADSQPNSPPTHSTAHPPHLSGPATRLLTATKGEGMYLSMPKSPVRWQARMKASASPRELMTAAAQGETKVGGGIRGQPVYWETNLGGLGARIGESATGPGRMGGHPPFHSPSLHPSLPTAPTQPPAHPPSQPSIHPPIQPPPPPT